jgi:hypothetical protein
MVGMVGKQGVAAPVSSRLVCQPCFMCQLLHHCVNDSLLLYMHVAVSTKGNTGLTMLLTVALTTNTLQS